jgi:hypothetical protein
MKADELNRIYERAIRDLDEPEKSVANVAFAAGFLMGGEMHHSAMTVMALAARRFGRDANFLDLKRRLGLE